MSILIGSEKSVNTTASSSSPRRCAGFLALVQVRATPTTTPSNSRQRRAPRLRNRSGRTRRMTRAEFVLNHTCSNRSGNRDPHLSHRPAPRAAPHVYVTSAPPVVDRDARWGIRSSTAVAPELCVPRTLTPGARRLEPRSLLLVCSWQPRLSQSHI